VRISVPPRFLRLLLFIPCRFLRCFLVDDQARFCQRRVDSFTQAMKKLMLLLMLFSGAVSVFAQGSVTFRNSVPFQTPDPSSPTGARLVYACGSPLDATTGVGLTGTQYVTELYAGSSAGSLMPVTASISRFRSTTSANKGKWGLQTVNGVANDPMVLPNNDFGTTAFLQVKVWDFSTSATYEGASGLTIASAVFTYKVPQAGDLLLSDYFMEGFGSFAALSCPEPSVMVLGLAGLGSFALVRCSKRKGRTGRN